MTKPTQMKLLKPQSPAARQELRCQSASCHLLEAPPDGNPDTESHSQATQMVRLAEDAELFCAPDGQPYVTFAVKDHRETWPVKSEGVRGYLNHAYYRNTNGAPSAQAIREAQNTLEAKAKYDGDVQRVYIRTAEHAGALYVDFANNSWEVCQIMATGWTILERSPVKFRRTKNMTPLPHPKRGGSVNLLRPFVNASEDDFTKVVAFILWALCPYGKYPVLVINGPQGAAKTTTARVIRTLIDPSLQDVRSAPRTEQDLMIMLNNSWLLSFDNLSRLPAWLSDALCRVSTGGAFGTRKLYTDSDETLFQGERPCILNGIDELATRGDLLQRSLIANLPTISQTARRNENEFWAEFEEVHPLILGALFDVTSKALARLTDVKPDALPRMADFARWAIAAEPALGWWPGQFLSMYNRNQTEASDQALDGSPVAALLSKLVEKGDWTGTATDLLKELNAWVSEDDRKHRQWPKTGKNLSNALRRLSPDLETIGITVTFTRDTSRRRQRLITIARHEQTEVPPEPSGPTASSQNEGASVECLSSDFEAGVWDRVERDDADDADVEDEPPF